MHAILLLSSWHIEQKLRVLTSLTQLKHAVAKVRVSGLRVIHDHLPSSEVRKTSHIGRVEIGIAKEERPVDIEVRSRGMQHALVLFIERIHQVAHVMHILELVQFVHSLVEARLWLRASANTRCCTLELLVLRHAVRKAIAVEVNIGEHGLHLVEVGVLLLPIRVRILTFESLDLILMLIDVVRMNDKAFMHYISIVDWFMSWNFFL